MESKRLIFNAYYEFLYNTLLERRERISDTIKNLLPAELSHFGPYSSDNFDAYFDACLAFLDERLEMYNPFGVQYTFDNLHSAFAKKLELQLSWFDSSREFEDLEGAVDEILALGFDENKLDDYVGRLVLRFGAYPDRSIIDSFRLNPAARKLPDFLLAQSIEQVIHEEK